MVHQFLMELTQSVSALHAHKMMEPLMLPLLMQHQKVKGVYFGHMASVCYSVALKGTRISAANYAEFVNS